MSPQRQRNDTPVAVGDVRNAGDVDPTRTRQHDEDARRPRHGLLGLRIAAGVLLLFGLIVLYQAFQIRQGGGFSVVGPRVFPVVVALGLIVFATLFLLRATLMPDEDLIEKAAAEEQATHWPSVGVVIAILVVYVFALQPLGYVVATALFLPVVARVLGSRQLLRDVLVGIGVAVVIYVGFTRYLGVRLPAGPLDFIL
jgi:putative tricarboxylic transport membrane protein